LVYSRDYLILFYNRFLFKKKKNELEENARIPSRNSPALQDRSPPSPQAQQDPPPPSPVEPLTDKENRNIVPRKRGRKTKTNK